MLGDEQEETPTMCLPRGETDRTLDEDEIPMDLRCRVCSGVPSPAIVKRLAERARAAEAADAAPCADA